MIMMLMVPLVNAELRPVNSTLYFDFQEPNMFILLTETTEKIFSWGNNTTAADVNYTYTFYRDDNYWCVNNTIPAECPMVNYTECNYYADDLIKCTDERSEYKTAHTHVIEQRDECREELNDTKSERDTERDAKETLDVEIVEWQNKYNAENNQNNELRQKLADDGEKDSSNLPMGIAIGAIITWLITRKETDLPPEVEELG